MQGKTANLRKLYFRLINLFMTHRDLFYQYLGLPSLHPVDVEIVGAEGLYVTDSQGRQYMDFISGITVNNYGHRHPEILKAIRKQLDRFLHLAVYGDFVQSPQVLLAQKLVTLLPDPLQTVFFVNSGSEAIEGAVKLAKRYTGRPEIIAFDNGYHGSTQGALSILGKEEMKQAFRPLLPHVRFLEFNNFKDLQRISSKTACVVAETIQAEAGLVLQEEGYLEEIRNCCSETGTLLVVDDVQMGFGRTGKLFSFEHFGVVPDILVLAKALGAGMPLGAFITSREIMCTLASDPELGHITTFGGHPVSCAAGMAGLEILCSGDLLSEVELKGARIESNLKGHPMIRSLRRKGLALGIELADPEKRQFITEETIANGLLIDWYLFQPATFRLAPPLTVTLAEIDTACTALLSVLTKATRT